MEKSKSAKWDERYARHQFAYGESENEFLRSSAHYLPMGKILSLGEGEGRNALFLAKRGYDITAVDFSKIGLEKVRKRAAESNLTIHTQFADLTEYDFGYEHWQGIIAIYFHIHKSNRSKVLRNCINGLTKNGVIIMECYSTHQLSFGTGGPKDLDLLYDLEEIKEELSGLNFKIARTVERNIIEGEFHTGTGSVIQLVGQKIS